MKQQRPKFRPLQMHFTTVNVPISKVGDIVGGKVKENIDIAITNPKQGFENACAIRLSWALLHSGVVIANQPGKWATVSGKDKKQYIYRVEDLKRFLIETFGKPDKVIKQPEPAQLANQTGILVFTKAFGNATGHATLWDGRECSDKCYFDGAVKAELWGLK